MNGNEENILLIAMQLYLRDKIEIYERKFHPEEQISTKI